MKFPAQFRPLDGHTQVSFRDIPEAVTAGDTPEEARAKAPEALATAMDFYFAERRPVPPPSSLQEGEEWVEMPLSVAIKVELLHEILRQRVRPSELARAMGLRPQDITRLLEPRHQTKLDTLALAFSVLGKRLELQIR